MRTIYHIVTFLAALAVLAYVGVRAYEHRAEIIDSCPWLKRAVHPEQPKPCPCGHQHSSNKTPPNEVKCKCGNTCLCNECKCEKEGVAKLCKCNDKCPCAVAAYGSCSCGAGTGTIPKVDGKELPPRNRCSDECQCVYKGPPRP